MRRSRAVWVAAVAAQFATLVTPAAAGPTCFGRPATIVGTDKDDRLEGTSGPDVIVGLGGLDSIEGAGGPDLICGGDNPVRFHPDDDDLPMPEHLSGGGGDDRIGGGGGPDSIAGGSGADVLRGGRGHDAISGGDGPDRGWGGRGHDRIMECGRRLGDGADDDTFHGGRGNDSLLDHFGDDLLDGDAGRDSVIGGDGSDLVRGGAGPDRLTGADGDDRVAGGPGRDLADFVFKHGSCSSSGNPTDMVIDLSKGVARGLGTDSLRGVEGALTGSGDDLLIGDGRANLFFTGAPFRSGRERVVGRGGRDAISFATDEYEGGCCTSVYADLSRRRARWGNTVIRLSSVENIVGSLEADTLIGDGKRNRIDARSGDDVVSGRGGDDLLLGGTRASLEYPHLDEDVINGNSGDDVSRGGVGSDDLDGGPGADRNFGGPDHDRCVSPDRSQGARGCEAP